MSGPTLRGYQESCIVKTCDAFFTHGLNRVQNKSPTGCHRKGQGILMFDGSVRAVEDILVGDQVMGPDSTPRLVVALASGREEMVEIVPTKGTPWVVNRSHVLTLQRTRQNKPPVKKKRYKNCRDEEVIDVTVNDYLKWSKTQKHLHKLRRYAVDMPAMAVPIDPYVLGVILGDGTLFNNSRLGFSSVDREVIDLMTSHAESIGQRFNQERCTFTFRSVVAYKRNPLSKELRRLGLLPIACEDRFIPPIYKQNERRVRLEVLAGLVDTDGSYDGSGFDYLSKSPLLAADVAYLARSVGLAAYIAPKRVDGVVYHRVCISGDCDIVPTQITRKQAPARKQKKTVLRTGFTIRPLAGWENYYGFSLTGDGRYLLDDFTVTHNTGKTVTFAALPRWPALVEWMDQHPVKGAQMLVIAHREELIEQAAEKIRTQNPGLMVAVEQGDRYASRYCNVVVASIQSLAAMKFRRLKRLLQYHQFRIVIVDEAHHAAASTYRTVLVMLGFLPAADASDVESLEAPSYDDVTEMEKALAGWDVIAPKDRLLIGMTATPNRSDAIGLGCVFQTLAFEYALRQAIMDEWLVPILPWVIETDTSLDAVRTSHGDFNQRQLSDTVNTQHRNDLALAAWHEHAEGVQTLAFTVDVAHAHALADTFVAGGVRAKALSGKTPSDERRRMLEDFRRGRLDVITNCAVLTEGTDLPMCGCILHAKPTKSATLYEQMTGRGLRLYEAEDGTKKQHCVVIDLVDVARKHTLQAAPMLYGLPPTLSVKGEKLELVAAEYEALIEKYPGLSIGEGQRKTLADLKARAATFDLWKPLALGSFGEGRTLDWIKVGEDRYQVSYPWSDGRETVTVQSDMLGQFTVSMTLRPSEGGASRQRTIGARIPNARQAAALAETYVLAERRSVMKSFAKDAPWKSAPMSPGQRQLLEARRIPYPKGATKGQASELIELDKARRAR